MIRTDHIPNYQIPASVLRYLRLPSNICKLTFYASYLDQSTASHWLFHDRGPYLIKGWFALLCKSMYWFLYDTDLLHERVNALENRKSRVLLLILRGLTESDPGLLQTSNMECFPITFNGFSILDVGGSPE